MLVRCTGDDLLVKRDLSKKRRSLGRCAVHNFPPPNPDPLRDRLAETYADLVRPRRGTRSCRRPRAGGTQ